MSAGAEHAVGSATDGAPDSYWGNRQRLDHGVAVMGGVGGDVVTYLGTGSPDEAVTERIVRPRLREGPYPAADVRNNLRGFVEPPVHAQCRKVLDSRILLLRARSGEGASTVAFALLEERYGAGGITGLDSPDDLSRWRPKEGRGYLLQGLSPEAAASLGEVRLTGLAELLRAAGAHLVVTLRMETALPGDTVPWQVVHRSPSAAEVAVKRLNVMAEQGVLTTGQESEALAHLTSADFTRYLLAHSLPQDGIDVAKGLRDLVVTGKPAGSVLDDLMTGNPGAARKVLVEARHRSDQLSLMAAISLLPDQDRTVVEEFSAILRPLIEERGGPRETGTEGVGQQRDVLGTALEDRLAAVGALLLPARYGGPQRYPVQPVVFSGRHRSDALLRCLWLDYEGMQGLLWQALDALPHRTGIELTAGQAIGRVLGHATGPHTLRQLSGFAESERRWRRRLVAYALGEMVQHPALTGAVREQLRQWSRAAPVTVRCTVAETCAGSYGLARPAVALNLLDAVLDAPGKDLEGTLRTAVSFALSTLLSEDTNHVLVLDRLRKWQGYQPGTRHHSLAVHVIESLSRTAFPQPGAPGVRRVSLADLIADHPDHAFALVVTALDDPATHDAAASGLARIESDPALRERADAFPYFLAALSGSARRHRGVLRFLLRRHRARTGSSAERFAS